MWIPSTSSITARAAPITPNNKSNAITIATWVLVVIFVGMVLSRQALKFVVLRKVGADDFLIFLAAIFGIGLSATTLILASKGLGVLEPLTVARADVLMKGYYASDFLYISSLCFAKLSLVTYFYSLVVQRAQKRTILGLGIFILLWSVASLAAVAFQCKLPRPWEMMTLNCYNRGIFWIVYCIIDMTTDVAIIMLSVNLVAYLTMKFSRKVTVVACFAPRLLVIGAALARLIYIYPITPHSHPEYNLWTPIICTQIQVCLSISTACIPYMKPFFEGTEGGVWRREDSVRKRLTPDNVDTIERSGSSRPATQRRGKGAYSMDSTVTTSPKIGRASDISPRIPSPPPLSPLTTPRLSFATSSKRSSRVASERGLRLEIPASCSRLATVSPVTTPKTASSHALSPECVTPLSPPNLLPAPSSSPIRGRTPPAPSHNPHTPGRETHHDVSPISPRSPTKSPAPNFSLFPPPASGRYSLMPQTRPQVRVAKQRMARANTSQPRGAPQKLPPRTSSLQQEGERRQTNAKFAVAPNPRNPSPSARIPSYYAKPTSSSSVGAALAIPRELLHRQPSASDHTLPVSPAPARQRNQRILSPHNSSHSNLISPVSPPSAENLQTFWRDDISPESAHPTHHETPMRANRPWESRPWDIDDRPVLRDTRSSPQIVIRRPS